MKSSNICVIGVSKEKSNGTGKKFLNFPKCGQRHKFRVQNLSDPQAR